MFPCAAVHTRSQGGAGKVRIEMVVWKAACYWRRFCVLLMDQKLAQEVNYLSFISNKKMYINTKVKLVRYYIIM